MENTKEKAVKQALATLNIDKIPISSEFLKTLKSPEELQNINKTH